MGIKSPINIKILNDTLDIVTLMTHVQRHTLLERRFSSTARLQRHTSHL